MRSKLVIVLLAVCVLTGCGKNVQDKVSTENIQKMEKIKEADTTKSEEERFETDISNLEATLNNFDHIENVAYVLKDRLLVVADQLYLIDVISGKIVASNTECSYATGEIKVYSDDKNIIIVGEESRDVGDEEIVFYDPDDENAPKKSILYYDYQLNLVANINIYDTFDLNPDFVQYIAVSKSGKIAVYDANCSELYLCDIDTKEKKKIFGENDTELIYNNQIQFTISGGIEFVQDDERIVFKADCMDYPIEDGANSYCGIGSVTTEGKECFVEKAGVEYSKLESFDNYAILSQDCGFSSPTGGVIKYSFDTDCTETVELKTKEESESLCCSENGSILAASEGNGDKGWNLRFYDAETGKFLGEESYDELSSEKYRKPKIYTYENLNVAILLFYTNDENGKDKFVIMQI